MCGRYSLYETKDLGPRFHLANMPRFVSEDRYNIAPRQWLPVIVNDPAKGRIAEPMQWGFMPPWSKDPAKERLRPINTKAEAAFESRIWKGAIAHHRCLVPARGFYEWKHVAEQLKVPYFIHPKDQALCVRRYL
jgi:putative SOS response-associated peptidase YedK